MILEIIGLRGAILSFQADVASAKEYDCSQGHADHIHFGMWPASSEFPRPWSHVVLVRRLSPRSVFSLAFHMPQDGTVRCFLKGDMLQMAMHELSADRAYHIQINKALRNPLR